MMKQVRIEITSTTDNGTTSFSYPIDMSLVSNLRYAFDFSYAIGEVSDSTTLPSGVAIATQSDIDGLKNPDARKPALKDQARDQYAQTLKTGFTFDGATFSIADPARRQRLLEIVSQVNAFRNGDATNALPNGKSTVQFFDNSGTAHDFDATQVVQFGETGNGFVQDADERIAQIMGQIDAATSHAELDVIDIEAGWPA